MILKIDSSDNKKVSVDLLEKDRKVDTMYSDSLILKSEAILILIDKILKKNKLSLGNIEKIEVNEGPGSYTGLRVGAAIANALGFLLKVPVNGKVGELVNPVYNK
jgi:tRNA threonylcarbamoyladenosine biosynthesis protein TsaB